MSGISGPAVYPCPWCGRSVEQGESCWCKQSQEAAMSRQELRAELKKARADNVRLTAERDRLQAQVRELENSFFCPHCNAKFPTTADGAIEALEHEQTCKQSPIVRERDRLQAELEKERGAREKAEMCSVCHGTGKVDDSQAWDVGQEPSDCPYCPSVVDALRAERDRLRELIKAGALLQAEIERELRAKDGEVKP